MYTDTLNSIISYLALREPFTTLLDKGCVCTHKKVAMTCAYLGSKQTIMQYVVTFFILFVNNFWNLLTFISQNKIAFHHCNFMFWKVITTFWSVRRHISEMHGCGYGCLDCQLTPDNPMAKTI